jgi:hypothetical protein
MPTTGYAFFYTVGSGALPNGGKWSVDVTFDQDADFECHSMRLYNVRRVTLALTEGPSATTYHLGSDMFMDGELPMMLPKLYKRGDVLRVEFRDSSVCCKYMRFVNWFKRRNRAQLVLVGYKTGINS